MKTYKIDPLGKKRPLMLVRGTRLPEVFPDSIAESLVNSLAENSRGLVVGITGQATPTEIVGDLVFSTSGSDDQSSVAMIREAWGSKQGVTWEDGRGQVYKLECNSVPKGELFGGTNPYYTGPYKDLKQFVRNVIPYTGQPLTTSNCRQWFSYTTEDGVALTFRGCIQAQKQGGEYAGLKIDKIELGQETIDDHIVDIPEDMCITLDCTESVVLGMPNGMNGNVPLPYLPGIGWLQIVATDEFKSHLNDFIESDGDGDAAEKQWSGTNYDGFTYNIILSGIFTDPHQFRKPNNAASCRIKVKENSPLCNSTIGNADGYAVEYFGVSMVNPIKEGIYADVSPVLDGSANTVDIPAYGWKYMVIRVPNVSSADEVLHVNIPAPSTNKMVSNITFVTMNGRKVAANDLAVGDNELILPEVSDMFAFFNITNMSAEAITVTISRTASQPEPARTPGFYSADGQLIKAMTKDEVEHGYGYDNYPAKVNEAVKTVTNFVWPDGVTRVGASVFSDCAGLTEVTIPSTVTSVGESSFKGCTGLTTVAIPEGVTSIGMAAFSGCTALATAPIPNTVTTIGAEAFRGTKLTRVEIPQGVTVIDYNTFTECYALTSVTIPEGVTSIGESAFRNCTGLTSVDIPSTVTSIGDNVFYNCPALTSVTIPEGVTSIGQQSFLYCTGLTSVDIPSTVTSIGPNAFDNCSGLTSVTIPEGVTSIGESAFNRCTNLTSVTIPEGVTSIGESAFRNCTGLTSVTIPSTVTLIGGNVFNSCMSLTSVTIPEGVTSIEGTAFNRCTNLTSVTIPSTVTEIRGYAFADCTSLNPLTVPNTVATIGYDAFLNVPKVIYSGSATGSPWGATEVAAS